MKWIGAIALGCACAATSGQAAAKAACQPHEAGASYPWDIQGTLPGDKYASVFIDVDRTGKPLSCRVGNSNIFDDFTRFQLCSAYKEDWHAPSAAPGDPDRRTIRRDTVMIGSEHELANQKARRAWFSSHPQERSSCYPEN